MYKRPSIFSNEKASASAGTGKTYMLASRFLALVLARKENPSSIVALTFTRKTAGEFLTSILERISQACLSNEKLEELSLVISKFAGESESKNFIKKSDLENLLKNCIANLNRLNLTTIDSLCLSFMKAFSNELNIFRSITIMNDYMISLERRKVLDRILNEELTKTDFQNFYEFIKTATFGLDEKSLFKTIDEIVKNSHNLLLNYSDDFLEKYNINPEKFWGDTQYIFGLSTLKWDNELYKIELEKLKSYFVQDGLNGKSDLAVLKFFEECDNFSVPSKMPVRVENWAYEFRENDSISSASPEIIKVVNNLFGMILGANLDRLSSATKSIYRFCKIYEYEYDKEVRSKGKLVFDDIPFLLSEIKRNDVKTLFEYRLDCRINHWMFDEFQDTSRKQWLVFKDLLDDILLYENENKTFFYVGDPKQSIYAWRDGDYRLFNDIFEYYNKNADGRIVNSDPLNDSFRSGKEIIDIVNSFFQNEKVCASVFTQNSANMFCGGENPMFQKHSVAKRNLNKKCLSELRLVDDSEDDSFNSIYEEIFKILKEVNPIKNKKSCGILVSKNDTIKDIVSYIRNRISEDGIDMQISGDLERGISEENMIVSSFIQLIHAVAHPEDTASRWYISKTPISEFVDNFSENFICDSIFKISQNGFVEFAKNFVSKLSSKINDEFSKQSFSFLIEAAREFDSLGDRNIDEFISFIREKKIRIGTAENTIQVMTVHKSKGLGFDMVILPDLHKLSIRIRGGLNPILPRKIYKDKFGRKENFERGIFISPQKTICALNNSLMQFYESSKDKEAFESICKLYVAITRAKSAMYMIMPKLNDGDVTTKLKKSKYKEDSKIKLNMAQMILASFTGINKFENLYEIEEAIKDFYDTRVSIGDRNWFIDKTNPSSFHIPKIPKIEKLAFRVPIFEIQQPSNKLYTNIFDNRINIGIDIHSVLEKVYTFEKFEELSDIISNAKISSPNKSIIHEKFERIFKNPKILSLFKYEENVKIFNEFKFSVVLNGKLVNGSIDRLMLRYDSTKNIHSAIIVDYKKIAKDIANYSAQLKLYTSAVSRLFSIDENVIKSVIIGYEDSNISEYSCK